MVIFGLMVRVYGNNNSVIQFLFIWSSDLGLMTLSQNTQNLRFFSDFGTKKFQVDQNALNKSSFAKVVLKESLRMFPVSVGVGRVLPDHAVFSGYHVPAGTVIVTQNQVSCRLPQFCPNPDQFLPERWIKGHKGINI